MLRIKWRDPFDDCGIVEPITLKLLTSKDMQLYVESLHEDYIKHFNLEVAWKYDPK